MTKSLTRNFLLFVFLIFIVIVGEFYYLFQTQTLSQKQILLKRDFVAKVLLPDAALSNALPIRERTLMGEFDKYPNAQQFIATQKQTFVLQIQR